MGIDKTHTKLTQEISQLILDIETNFPELYNHLDEDISGMKASLDNGDVTQDDLMQYLNGLKAKLAHYKEMHK